MKKYLSAFPLFFMTWSCFSQTTATNFTVTDCAGASHSLFSEFDAGKVVVLVWVMPCGSCSGPAKTAYNVVETYKSGPYDVKCYIVDDYANTNCTTLSGWADSYSIGTNSAKFSNANIDMYDYGSPGMPKVVVAGGISHSVYYNANSGVTSTAITNAINQAIADTATTGVNDYLKTNSQLNLFPNPAVNTTTISYSLNEPSEVSLDLFNLLGEKVRTILSPKDQHTGSYQLTLNCSDLSKGVYFVKFSAANKSQYIKFNVVH